MKNDKAAFGKGRDMAIPVKTAVESQADISSFRDGS